MEATTPGSLARFLTDVARSSLPSRAALRPLLRSDDGGTSAIGGCGRASPVVAAPMDFTGMPRGGGPAWLLDPSLPLCSNRGEGCRLLSLRLQRKAHVETRVVFGAS